MLKSPSHAFTARAISCRRRYAIDAGEVVSLLGRNGVRLSTRQAIRARSAQGSIKFKGITSRACRATGSPILGCYVRTSCDIFPGLTVRQKPDARHQGYQTRRQVAAPDILKMFSPTSPQGRHLSRRATGGEKQMLTNCTHGWATLN